MKLSKRQQQVVDKMQEGWALGHSTTYNGRTWLQKDGLGHGGPIIEVHGSTFISLHQKGIIKAGAYSFPSREYYLVNKLNTPPTAQEGE